jgi:ribonuclease P protein component
MLKKSQRLTRAAFVDCFSKGKRIHAPFTTSIISPAETFSCAVVVGKKVAKKAVTRNALRRGAYGVIERLLADRHVQGVYIFVLKPVAASTSRAVLLSALEAEFGRVLN